MNKVSVPTLLIAKGTRKYTLDERYFQIIDTEEKAYWLGMLASDGYVSDRGRIELGLSGDDDRCLLESFGRAIGTNAPVLPHLLRYKGAKPAYRIGANSRKMVKDLGRLGVTTRKSLNLSFPTLDQVPEQLLRHFVRGYFDGDGSVSLKRDGTFLIGVTSSPRFIQALQETLSTRLDLTSHIENNKRRTGSLKIGGNFVCFLFLDWIYRDASVYMSRKQIKYVMSKELIANKLKNKQSFYNIYQHPQVMKSATRCALILDIPFDMSDYNGLRSSVDVQGEIVRLYVSGLGIRRLRRRFECSDTLIRNTLRRNGVQLRPRYTKGYIKCI